MRYKIVEIGTSDFRIDSLNEIETCLLIEPVKFYLDRIPDQSNIIKLNVAISDENGYTNVYYSNLDYIIENKLPNWLRGCNSIEHKHPTVIQYCKDNNIIEDDLIIKQRIEKITPETLFSMYSIDYIDFLKIDTEGHDTIILESLMNASNKPVIDKIKFESNVLTDESDYRRITSILEKDYVLKRYPQDTIAIKKNRN